MIKIESGEEPRKIPDSFGWSNARSASYGFSIERLSSLSGHAAQKHQSYFLLL